MKTNTSGVSKYQHTEYNRYKRVQSRVNECYASCFSFHSTFAEFLKHKQEILLSEDYEKLTPYYKGMISGVDTYLFNSLYECRFGNPGPLMFAHIGPDMHLFVDGDDSWLSESHEYKANMICIYIWRQPWIKNRDFRPF